MLGLYVLTERRYSVVSMMVEELEITLGVGVVFALDPVETGRSVGVIDVEGRLLPESMVLASKEEEVLVVLGYT